MFNMYTHDDNGHLLTTYIYIIDACKVIRDYKDRKGKYLNII